MHQESRLNNGRIRSSSLQNIKTLPPTSPRPPNGRSAKPIRHPADKNPQQQQNLKIELVNISDSVQLDCKKVRDDNKTTPKKRDMVNVNKDCTNDEAGI